MTLMSNPPPYLSKIAGPPGSGDISRKTGRLRGFGWARSGANWAHLGPQTRDAPEVGPVGVFGASKRAPFSHISQSYERLYDCHHIQLSRVWLGQRRSIVVSAETAPDTLHDLFWNSELHPSPAEGVNWRRRFKIATETLMRIRGLPPDEARGEALLGLVVTYSNETFPRNCDPNCCAHCHRSTDPTAPLVPLGVGPHAWVHRLCADLWREGRRKAAIAALAAMKIGTS